MKYFDDPQLLLRLNSQDETVRPKGHPNVPGEYVRDLQNDLNGLGYVAGPADGWFGAKTGEAVRAFQADAGASARQEQGSATAPGRRFAEKPVVYTQGVSAVVGPATAEEILRWKTNRWQRPTGSSSLEIEDLSGRLPTNPHLTAKIRALSAIDRVVLHCTDAAPTFDVFRCAQYDVGPNHISAKGCPSITYAYFVNPDGHVQKCLSHTVVSWHVGDWNLRSLGVALAYRATGNPEPPPTAQLEAARELCVSLCGQLRLRPEVSVVGHRELPGTGYNLVNGVRRLRKECPGLRVDLDDFRREVVRRLGPLGVA